MAFITACAEGSLRCVRLRLHMCAPLRTSSSVCDSVTNLHYRAHLLTSRRRGGGGAEKIAIDIAMVTVTPLFPVRHTALCVCLGGAAFLWGLDVLFLRYGRRRTGKVTGITASASGK